MAIYSIAQGITKRNEGGFVNDPNDSGGYTYCGISYRNFPSWPYWAKIRAANLHTGQILPELVSAVDAFYKAEFWDKVRGDEIFSQEVANKLYDSAVNLGIKQAVDAVQQAAGIAPTGWMDNHTLSILNNSNPYA